MEGTENRTIPGGALTVHPSLPYHGLEKFGVSFLNKFMGVQSTSPILKSISFIDSPGVLSGEKQSISRGYDFVDVSSWFAEQADLIIVLFDADKLDISDELRNVLLGLLPNREKIRFVLNKADQVTQPFRSPLAPYLSLPASWINRTCYEFMVPYFGRLERSSRPLRFQESMLVLIGLQRILIVKILISLNMRSMIFLKSYLISLPIILFEKLISSQDDVDK
jgi:hypothetical protein